MRRRTAACVAALAAASGIAVAQPADFSGTWKRDEGRSRVAAAAPLLGLIGAGLPDTLHVTQPASGALVVESQINESHVRLYVPGATTSTLVFLGPAGRLTMRSRREARALVSEGVLESTSGNAPLVTDVREVLTLAPDGGTLTIEVTLTARDGKSASTGIYVRTRGVGPCKSWPTPCKSQPPETPR